MYLRGEVLPTSAQQGHHPTILRRLAGSCAAIDRLDVRPHASFQSPALREYSHDHRPDLPTLLITHNSINLERPTLNSRSIVEQQKKERLQVTSHESKVLKKIKHELNLDDDEKSTPKKKKKKKSGVNPLSNKKKKNKKTLGQTTTAELPTKKKRRRTRQLRMSPHLKEHLRELQKTFSIKSFLLENHSL